MSLIKNPILYLVFVQAFVSDQIDLMGEKGRFKDILDEVDFLLEWGKERFRLQHRRSLAFLLGIDYPRFKRVMENLEHKKITCQEASDELETAILKPLKSLTEPKFKYSGTPKRELLAQLLQIAAEPSYDRALALFCEEIRKAIETLGKCLQGEHTKANYRIIASEANEFLTFVRQRSRSRLGFPLYDMIDEKSGRRMSSFCQIYDKERDQLTPGRVSDELSRISESLRDFSNLQDDSRDAFASDLVNGLKGRTDIIDPQNDLFLLYGVSSSVGTFISNSVLEQNKRSARFISIKTNNLATTPSEELKMRDYLIEHGFVNVAVHGYQDLLAFGNLHRNIVFCLGYEIINCDRSCGQAVFHFGAGQLLGQLMFSLVDKQNTVKVLLIGPQYKEINYKITSDQVEHASIFNIGDLPAQIRVWLLPKDLAAPPAGGV